MFKAIAMMGNDHIIAKMKKELKRIDINLEDRDYQTLEDVIEQMQNTAIDVIFLAENSVYSEKITERDSKNRLKQAVSALRENDETVKIIIFCGAHQQDASLDDWCKSKGVYDVFYPDTDGEFQLTKIVKQLKESSIIEKNIEIREKIVHVPVIEEKIVEVAVEKEVIKEVVVEKPVYIQTGGKSAGFTPPKPAAMQIGVFSISRGAGATYTSLLLAHGASEAGYKTAVIGCDGKPDLMLRKKDKLKVIVSEPNKFETEILKLNKADYRVIILDMGNISHTSELQIAAEAQTTKNEILLQKLLKVQHRVGVGFSSEWHLPALEYYAKNYDPDDFIFLMENAEQILRKYNYLNICDRNDNKSIDVLMQLFGIK